MNSQEPNFSAVMEKKISNFEQGDFSLVVVDDKGNYHILGLKMHAYSVNWLFSELFMVLKYWCMTERPHVNSLYVCIRQHYKF